MATQPTFNAMKTLVTIHSFSWIDCWRPCGKNQITSLSWTWPRYPRSDIWRNSKTSASYCLVHPISVCAKGSGCTISKPKETVVFLALKVEGRWYPESRRHHRKGLLKQSFYWSQYSCPSQTKRKNYLYCSTWRIQHPLRNSRTWAWWKKNQIFDEPQMASQTAKTNCLKTRRWHSSYHWAESSRCYVPFNFGRNLCYSWSFWLWKDLYFSSFV
jgi:hypothetical protein